MIVYSTTNTGYFWDGLLLPYLFLLQRAASTSPDNSYNISDRLCSDGLCSIGTCKANSEAAAGEKITEVFSVIGVPPNHPF